MRDILEAQERELLHTQEQLKKMTSERYAFERKVEMFQVQNLALKYGHDKELKRVKDSHVDVIKEIESRTRTERDHVEKELNESRSVAGSYKANTYPETEPDRWPHKGEQRKTTRLHRIGGTETDRTVQGQLDSEKTARTAGDEKHLDLSEQLKIEQSIRKETEKKVKIYLENTEDKLENASELYEYLRELLQTHCRRTASIVRRR